MFLVMTDSFESGSAALTVVMAAVFLTVLLVVLGLFGGVSLLIGFAVAKMLAATGVLAFSEAVWLGVSAILFVLLALSG